jgi:hypothetical protein
MFSFGADSSRSHSSSSSYGYSFSDSLEQALSKEKVAFEDVFAGLYGGATNAAARAATMTPTFEGQAADLYSGGMKFLDTLNEVSPLQARLDETGTADEQIGALGEDLGRFLREDINPAITSQGVATGTLGGGRQGVAQGRAADATIREFQRGATDIRTQDVARRDSLSAMLAEDRLGRTTTGLSSLASLYGIAEGGVTAGFAPYSSLSEILGGPTVLGESSAYGTSSSRGEDWSQSQSKSKSWGTSFGM